jgi:hypothetical protein
MNTYYVDSSATSAKGMNNGTISNPWTSLSSAISDVVAGDMIFCAQNRDELTVEHIKNKKQPKSKINKIRWIFDESECQIL